MKSEPDVFSIENLKQVKTTLWDGVRNYQARNFMMNEMQVGDEVLFYHSNAKPSGVAGLARIVGPALPDPSQFDKSSEYFDAKAKKDKPTWYSAQVTYVETFPRLLALEELRGQNSLRDMLLLRPGQRLSVQPVQAKEFACILKLARS